MQTKSPIETGGPNHLYKQEPEASNRRYTVIYSTPIATTDTVLKYPPIPTAVVAMQLTG